MSISINLKPWISLNRKQKGMPGQIRWNEEIRLDQPFPLIVIAALARQSLSLISSFTIEEQNQDQSSLVFVSQQTVAVGGVSYRVVYIPASKTDQEVLSSFADIFRELADIVISDINSANVHRLKEKQNLDNKHFVISGGKDIYEVAVKSNTLQLLNSIQVPFFGSLDSLLLQQRNIKRIYCSILVQSIKKYLQDWEWLLVCEKSWSLLSLFVFQQYKCSEWLRMDCQQYKQVCFQHKILSNQELQHLFEEMLSIKHFPKSYNGLIFRSIAQSTINKVRKMNQKNGIYHIKVLRQEINISQTQSQTGLKSTKSHLNHELSLQDLEDPLIDLLLLPKELEVHIQTIKGLNVKNRTLEVQVSKLTQIIASKDNSLKQCNQKTKIYQEKLSEFLVLQNRKRELTQHLQSQTLRNQQLSLQLQSHIVLERKSLESKVELENKILEQKREKEGLLQCLHELTQQNLSLLSIKEQLQIKVKQLKQSLQQTNQIQIRALRCIQNQAEIKTRLYRYQKYVSELKLSMKSFKKLESEKFNYILENNYRQYELLEKRFYEACCALKKEEAHSKTLNETLQRERIRLNYFEKLLISNYQHQSIPECSEQNSSTDRELPPISVQ